MSRGRVARREGKLRTRWLAPLAAATIWAASAVRADVWDIGADTDNDSGSDNELVHGLDQVHDVAAQGGGTVEDQDWFRFNHGCNFSYEVLLDGMTGGVSNGEQRRPSISWIPTGPCSETTPVTGFGVARRLADRCFATPPIEVTNFVRVSQPNCGLNCGSNAQYRIRFHDTTALLPRFNNSSSQVSVLVLQSSTDAVARVAWVAYDPAGTVLLTFSDVFQPNQAKTYNLSTTTAGALAGKSGSLKVLSDAPYGAVSGKVVAVEPATGFTFDTPLVYKPH
jgi:hypothetical protein